MPDITPAGSQPLSGLTVVEVGGSIPVAAATKLFSDYGAQVLKVEPLRGGALRRVGPFRGDVPDLELGAFHYTLDTGKRSVVVDLETPSGLEVFSRLAGAADIVFTHESAELTHRLLAEVRALDRRPHTVMLADQGLEGPYAARRENGSTLLAWSGRMRQHSLPGEEPLRYAPYVPEMQWGATAGAIGLACAWSGDHGGEVREVEVSGIEAMAGNVDTWFLHWEFMGAEWPRQAGQSNTSYPTGTYRCADGYVVFASANPPFFHRLFEAIGRPELITDPRFATPTAKVGHFQEFFEILDPWLRERTRDEVFTHLQSHGVMVAPLLDISEVVTDRQSVARGSFVEHGLADGSKTILGGPPYRLQGEAWQAHPAPRLGADTDAILQELGYTTEERLALFRAGITG